MVALGVSGTSAALIKRPPVDLLSATSPDRRTSINPLANTHRLPSPGRTARLRWRAPISGIYVIPPGNGFQLNIAAAQTNRVLHVYLGSYQAVAHMQAYLSDNSAIKVVDESLPFGGTAKYNIKFAAGSPGQTLISRY